MTTTGAVRFWLDDQGYGVVDSPDTPGGCWVHFSAVAVAGYKRLTPGQPVSIEWEPADQDGYAFRALRAWPADGSPVEPDGQQTGPPGAYGSELAITWTAPVSEGGEARGRQRGARRSRGAPH